MDNLILIAKVFGLSLVLSLMIKFVGPLLPIPATTLAALVPVLGVPLTLGLILPRL